MKLNQYFWIFQKLRTENKKKIVVYMLSAAEDIRSGIDCFIGETSDSIFFSFYFGNCCETSVKWVEIGGSGTK